MKLLKKPTNYDIVLNADVTGGITDEQKAALIRKLATIGIDAEITSVTETSLDEAIADDDEIPQTYTSYIVQLEAIRSYNNLEAINVIRAHTGLGLVEANDLVDSIPCHVGSNLSLEEATDFKNQLEAIGAIVTLIGVDEMSHEALDNYVIFDVRLETAGGQKLAVIKLIKELTDLSLADAKALADRAPCYLKRDVTLDVAESFKTILEEAGASVRIIGVEEVSE